MNRREFVAGTALAAVALASPFGFSAAAGKTWRVAVIGHTGRGAYGHDIDLMWRKVPRTEAVAVADADPAGLAAARKRLGDVRGFDDYRRMLAEVKPEIVAVAPRYCDEHHAMCMEAIGAGARGLYVEKPFCRTPREADEVVAACAEKKVKLAVAHRNRYHPVLPVIKGLVAGGEIGKVLEIRARGKEDSRGGAQDLWVLGSHLFNLACYLAGAPAACSGMLYQNGRPCTRADIRAGDEGIGPIAGNRVHARFEMEGGMPLFFDSVQNRGDKAAGFGLQLVGSAGVIDIRADMEPLAHVRRGNPHNPIGPDRRWAPITSAGVDRPEAAEVAARVASHQAAGEDLIAAIEQDRDPVCDGAAGRRTVEMICAIFESHRRGGARVEMPLKMRENPLSLM